MQIPPSAADGAATIDLIAQLEPLRAALAEAHAGAAKMAKRAPAVVAALSRISAAVAEANGGGVGGTDGGDGGDGGTEAASGMDWEVALRLLNRDSIKQPYQLGLVMPRRAKPNQSHRRPPRTAVQSRALLRAGVRAVQVAGRKVAQRSRAWPLGRAVGARRRRAARCRHAGRSSRAVLAVAAGCSRRRLRRTRCRKQPRTHRHALAASARPRACSGSNAPPPAASPTRTYLWRKSRSRAPAALQDRVALPQRAPSGYRWAPSLTTRACRHALSKLRRCRRVLCECYSDARVPSRA